MEEKAITGSQEEAQRQRALILKSVRLLNHIGATAGIQDDVGAILSEIKEEIEAVLQEIVQHELGVKEKV